MVATRSTIAQAPLDSRSAFLLSMLDGNPTVDTLVDVTAMTKAEVTAILERLVRLGLVHWDG